MWSLGTWKNCMCIRSAQVERTMHFSGNKWRGRIGTITNTCMGHAKREFKVTKGWWSAGERPRAESISSLVALRGDHVRSSEIVPGTSVAPTVVEQGSRRRRGKSRDPSRAREELGDLETRLAKIELHLIDGDEKVEELDTRIEELDGGMEEFREEMQGALNRAVDKIMGEGESLKISFSNEVAALREENRFLREELDRVMGKVKDMEEQMSLVRMAILQGSVVGAALPRLLPRLGWRYLSQCVPWRKECKGD
ncbi:hypothetical protein GH714_044061 [Hevea brasiliensis]|uniref:Uncharacterized protein n=1 Tax=Hevea brasiliensis TaxID=3981 RepID=A0A6A6K0H1_HEVBR|nr:hypothetical protein GH714_044061 [Hevea brasiliensis]